MKICLWDTGARPLSIPILALSIIALCSPPLSAQQLEEIVVTAQRREQNLQEVPVSLEVFTGEQLLQQGVNIMDDLAVFSPSVEIRSNSREYDISIRGQGSRGPNPALEQSAASFVDGVHISRGSMVHGAYLDLERLEVLRGPQPVHFGMNATAGAFSLTTKKPGPEWEGNLTGEVGNFGSRRVEGGIGGPVTDTLGVRVAGKWGDTDGFLKDVVFNENFPAREDKAGRITLQWTPNEAFEATLSATVQKVDSEGSAWAFCKSFATPALTEYATYVPGMVPEWDAIKVVTPLPDCETEGFTQLGRRAGDENPFSPVGAIREHNNQSSIADFTDIWREEFGTTEAFFHMNAKNYRLGLAYQLNNDITIESTTAYLDYFRQSLESNLAPIIGSYDYGTEVFDMASQEIRVSSAAGGTFEWEFGGYYHKEDMDQGPSCAVEAGPRRPVRCNDAWQDATWKNLFGSITFNHDKFSIDVGARHSWVSKEARLIALGKTMIWNINPDPDGNGVVVANTGQTITTSIIDCATGSAQCGSYRAGFWTQRWAGAPGGARRLPDVWHLQKPVALGPLLTGLRIGEGAEGQNGPGGNGYSGTYETNSLDPQIVLRYRPTEQMSLYVKYAEAIKAGGFDIGGKGAPVTDNAFTFTDETGKILEAGIKGTLLDGQMRYGVSLFRQRSYDLQIDTLDPVNGGTTITQAGMQETKGIEFDGAWSVTDRFMAGLSGAVMDGTMVEFPGSGCTDVEFANADNTLCYSAAESLAEFGHSNAAGTIDRSGFPATRTPDFKVAMRLDYWHPLTDNIKGTFNTVAAWSDDFIFDVEGFSNIVKWPRHVDWNLNLGIGEIDDTWAVTLFARNILNARVKYYRENDPFGSIELNSAAMQSSQYFSYGVQFQYNYN